MASPILPLPQFVSRFRLLVSLTLLASPLFASAQVYQATRIPSAIDNGERAALAGSQPPAARAENDRGALASNTTLNGIKLVFSRSAAQQAALDALIAAQQNPASPQYHQWLTPAQFGAQFGLPDADIAKIQSWLQSEGFTVDSISPSKTEITFSGTASLFAATFGAELHNYTANGETHFAPSADLSIPAALSAAVLSVRNVSSFHPKSHVIFKAPVAASTLRPDFTSSQTGSHFMTPKDVATIYDINAAYNAGYTGAGQSIAVLGQSQVALTDISNFQTAAGLPVKLPIPVLVPGSGAAYTSASDEAESDLDLEYSGAIAKGATVYFVYTGSNTNYDVFSAAEYAIQTRIAPIITLSYGDCEPDTSTSEVSTINQYLAQATAQGQTFINSSGDTGSTACYGFTNLPTATQESVAVSFPASSQYALSLGGTEFPAADVATTASNYWTAANGSDVIGSALSYIPEMVWNDDSSSTGLSSGGGGISTLTARPSWQTGVTGIPSGSYRLVPDISLDSSPNNAGYLYCSSAGYSTTGVNGSCSNGFRDSSNVSLTVAGGTSFAAPIFAGMLAIIEQRVGGSGLGLVNPTLYTLAANAGTYSTAFHDITSGSNECLAGSAYCTSAGAAVYTATTGYDEATGLGSIDLYNLMNSWASVISSPTLIASTTTLTAASSAPALGANDTITITIASGTTSVTSTPTGTVTLTVDGTAISPALTLTNGSATYTFSSSTAGTHVISATYSGSSIYNSSTGSTTLSIAASGTFTVAAAGNLTITDGNSGTTTVTVTPSGTYAGTVSWSISANPSAGLSNACYQLPNTTVTANTAASSTLTLYTSSTACAALAQKSTGYRSLSTAKSALVKPSLPANPAQSPTAFVFAGLLAALVLGRKNRRLRLVASLLLLGTLGIFLSGCSDNSGGSTSTTTNSNFATKGTYNLTIVGTDTTTSTITANTTITLTID
jgi:subtilase family serine protease